MFKKHLRFEKNITVAAMNSFTNAIAQRLMQVHFFSEIFFEDISINKKRRSLRRIPQSLLRLCQADNAHRHRHAKTQPMQQAA